MGKKDMTNEEIYEFIVSYLEDFELSDRITDIIILGIHGKIRRISIATDEEKGERYIG